MALKLTARQREILALIQRSIRERGIPPTRVEIATELGFKSANASEDHIKALARKGAIILTRGASRGIRLNPEFMQEHFPSGMIDGEDERVPMQTSPQSTSSLNSSLANPLSCGIESSSSHSSSTLTKAKQVIQHTVDEVSQFIQDTRLSLPVIGRVAAGNPINAIEHHENTLQLDAALFSATPDYLLKVKGESMKNIGILDGDLLAVKKTNSVHNGQIVVARIDDDVTVKRFQKQGSTITLLPENDDFKPIVVDASQHFEIEGIAVGLIRTDTTWH